MTTERSIIAKFKSEKKTQIRCCHVMNGHLYIGTGPDGIIYRTSSGYDVTEFYKTEDYYVTALADYGNALFAGTSSNGRIMMHNFNTGNRFHYVTSGDYQVTSFCVFQEKLYAGTSPSGLVLSFDGNQWLMEYDSYCGGIKSMRVLGDAMYVFVEQINFVPYLKGNKWLLLKSGDENFSISSFKKVQTQIPELEKNLNFDWSFGASCVCSGKLYFSPQNKCNLYSYDGSKVQILHQWDGDKIGAIEAIGSSQLAVSVDDTVYLYNLE